MRRFLPLTILLVVIGGLITAAWLWDGDGRWDRDRDEVRVVQVVDDQGQPIGDGTAVIIDRDGPPFFFPFGFLVVPLLFILLFWAIGRAFWGGRPGWNGPGGFQGETPPPWFERWYRRMQERPESRNEPRTDTGPQSSPEDRNA